VGFSEKAAFFRFCDLDIEAVFDPPHLPKCTRLLFLKHVVTIVWLGIILNGVGLTGTAKWADILNEIENQSVLYHRLHNMVDGYLKCFWLDAMKISSCAVL
jgi:hypothetical protein